MAQYIEASPKGGVDLVSKKHRGDVTTIKINHYGNIDSARSRTKWSLARKTVGSLSAVGFGIFALHQGVQDMQAHLNTLAVLSENHILAQATEVPYNSAYLDGVTGAVSDILFPTFLTLAGLRLATSIPDAIGSVAAVNRYGGTPRQARTKKS